MKLALTPTSSGVYLFKDHGNRVIYIGKAKSLRTRIRSYFKPTNDWKVQALVEEIADVACIQTKNETEALLLEAQLIQEHQPKFNVLLKTGQPFVYLVFTQDTPTRFEIVRNKDTKGIFFGPFLYKSDARRVHTYLTTTFKLKLCNKKIAGGCLDYHLDLCVGNCTGTFDRDEYNFRMQLALQALEGNYTAFLKNLKAKIMTYNLMFEFEKSRNLQQYVVNFEKIFATLRTHFTEKKYAHEAILATAPVDYKPIPSTALAGELQQLFKLPKPAHTIDCFDISHFQSNALVGSCIRFTDGVAEKNKFRRFKIKTLTQQNDYAALQEIVARRYRNPDELPDLILIDGGKGQLHAVQELFPTTPFISLAKREETIFSNSFPDGIKLDIQQDVGKVLIALRDYAHHFAITYHRKVRARERSNEYRKVHERRTRTIKS